MAGSSSRDRDPSLSPIEPLSRRNSNAGLGMGTRIGSYDNYGAGGGGGGGGGRWGRVAESGTLQRHPNSAGPGGASSTSYGTSRSGSQSQVGSRSTSRRASAERGGRIAETGSLARNATSTPTNANAVAVPLSNANVNASAQAHAHAMATRGRGRTRSHSIGNHNYPYTASQPLPSTREGREGDGEGEAAREMDEALHEMDRWENEDTRTEE
jgi:hypothetical protein